MRILWLSHLVPYPPKAGVLQRCYYLIHELAKYHEIDLLAFNQLGLLLSFYKSTETGISETKSALSNITRSLEYFDIPSEENYLGKKGLAIKGLFSPEGYTMEWLKSDVFAETLKRKLQKKKYDLVHFDTISLAVYRDLVRNIPVTLDHHNIESHMMLRRSCKERNLLKKLYYFQEGKKLLYQEKKWCNKFNLNITCSDMDTVRLKNIVGDLACESIPNGVDIEYFKPLGSQRREKSLIFIGTMNWYPNVEAVIYILNHIWPELRKRHPDVTLDIIGSSPPDVIMKYNNKHGITVHGFVYDIRPLFDSAHVYICPITDGGGTKLKILDAMAMGKAIVAHPVACEGINLVDGQSVVFCEEVSEYVANIDELFRDDQKVEFIGKNARDLAVREYAFSGIGRRLSDAFIKISGQ